MQQETSWDNKKAEILKILANVFLRDSSSEGIALTPGNETEKTISLYLASLGIELEPGSEAEKAMVMYLVGLKKKYSEYQNRISFWALSICLGDTICATPRFRKAWRNGSFDYKLQVVPPNGDCYYCSNLKQNIVEKGQSFAQCPLGLNVQCLPAVEAVYKSLENSSAVFPKEAQSSIPSFFPIDTTDGSCRS